MALEPWIIEQHEEEERRRRESDEARRSRIELPLTCPLPSGKTEQQERPAVEREPPAPRRVEIVPLSPGDENIGMGTFDL